MDSLPIIVLIGVYIFWKKGLYLLDFTIGDCLRYAVATSENIKDKRGKMCGR